MIGGVAKMPKSIRTEGTDGGKRHGDAAVALWNFHAASFNEALPVYRYEPVRSASRGAMDGPDDDDLDGRGWWRPPVGVRVGSGGPI